jgi:hypothetical protein
VDETVGCNRNRGKIAVFVFPKSVKAQREADGTIKWCSRLTQVRWNRNNCVEVVQIALSIEMTKN